jgi:hypothetical protein
MKLYQFNIIEKQQKTILVNAETDEEATTKIKQEIEKQGIEVKSIIRIGDYVEWKQ